MPTATHAENQRLLTIAIPTYNRADYLDLCLERIGEELDSLSTDKRRLVKIVVSNNASTDWTAQVIDKHLSINAGDFEWVQNSENIGADRNIAQCYALAATPYVWVFGDDDVMLPEGLKIVLEALQTQSPDIVFASGYHFSDHYLNALRVAPPTRQGVTIYCDATKFVRKTNVMLTFISAMIIKKNARLSFHYEDAIGSHLSQLAWILPILSTGSRFVIIDKWVVAAKAENTGGYSLVEVFGRNLNRITEHYLPDRPNLFRPIQNGAIVNFFPSFVLQIREGRSKFDGGNMRADFNEIYGNNWRYYLFIFPMLILPIWAARYYQLAIRLLRRLLRPILI